MGIVLAAIDKGASSERVLHHASGLARLFGAQLRVVHVAANASARARDDLRDYCLLHGPYVPEISEADYVVRCGLASDAIKREAHRDDVRMVVLGSHGYGKVARMILGSTSAAVLRDTPAPVLLVPPNDLDIVSFDAQGALTCGPLLAPVDLDAPSERQLRTVSWLSRLARQPWTLMTVARQRLSRERAQQRLSDCTHVTEAKPRALIVRRGNVAREIAHCAEAEGAGLVVMGLRERASDRPGEIAETVLGWNKAFVLAIPAH